MSAAWRDKAWQLSVFGLALLMLAGVLAFAAQMAGLLSPAGARPLGLDFAAFWSGARIALHQGARLAYDNAVVEAFERAHTQLSGPGYLAFYYPPAFLLLCLPLAALPYTLALLVFETAQAALLWPALKRILGCGWGWLPVLAYPGFVMNVFSGQNGGLSASCLAFAMLTLDRRPWLGGMFLGLLSYKPQLAACVPVALLAGRRWRAAAAAAGTAAVLAGVATLVLGQGAWDGFLANAPLARHDIETLAIKWRMSQSFYGAMRLSGCGLQAGYLVQGSVAVLAVAVLAWIGWRRRGAGPDMAALSVTALLVTPFLYDYDLVLLAAPIAWLAGEASRTRWLAGERILLLLCYLAPLGARAAGMALGVTIGPPLVLAMLAAIARRAARRDAPQTAPEAASQTAPGTASQTASQTAPPTAPEAAPQTAPGRASQTASQTAPGTGRPAVGAA
jgi:hypothetical protein